jgi:signal transduction histidine kinase/ActR/RegA family two-component response regulator
MRKNDLNILMSSLVSLLFIVASIVIMSWKPEESVYKILLDSSLTLYFLMMGSNVIWYYYQKHHHRSSLYKFIEFFNSLQEGLIIYDSKMELAFMSDKLQDLFGMPKRMISDGPVYDVNGVDLRKEVLSKFDDGIIIDDSIRATIFNRRSGRNVHININVLQLDLENVYFNVVLITDLTDYQEQMQNVSRQLIEAKEVASQKSSFLSRVSHELRTPLNGIIGMNQIAHEAYEKKDYAELKEAIDKVDISSKYLLLVINNVLNMSRIDAGKVKTQESTVSLNGIIDEVKVVVGSQVKEKKQEFNVIKNFDSLYIKSDEIKLTQIIINILSNSIKYTPDYGKISLTVLAKELINNKVELTVVVKDNGRGMSKEFAKHMFEPFSQENRVSNVPSTGLGLAITKSLIDLLGGKVDVHTEEGIGTETTMQFVFDIENSQEIVVVHEDEANLVDYSKFNVLVAEDNTINQIVIKNHLNYFKFNVDIANDGEEAVDIFKKSEVNHYDFILMDIHMPKMDGYEATLEIRSLEREDKNVPIIALTADALNEDVSKALINKMDNHIAKPVVRDEMIKTIYETLKAKNKLDK